MLVAGVGVSRADIIVGGINFQNNAFADTLVSSNGTFTTSGGTLPQVLVGSNPADYAFCFGGPSVCNVTLAFTDNTILNGAGADLAVFELGTPDPFQLTINGVTRTYSTASTGSSAGGFDLNVALVDLADFGVASTSLIRASSLDNATTGTTISYTVFGAINNGPAAVAVPEPSSLILFGTVVVTAGFGLRRRFAR